jgi:hypothetical protein
VETDPRNAYGPCEGLKTLHSETLHVQGRCHGEV